MVRVRVMVMVRVRVGVMVRVRVRVMIRVGVMVRVRVRDRAGTDRWSGRSRLSVGGSRVFSSGVSSFSSMAKREKP